MDKKDLHTTIFPYYDKEEFQYFYEVSVLRNLKKKAELVVLLDTIGKKQESFDVYQYEEKAHFNKDWNEAKQSVIKVLDGAPKMGYCILEIHMDKPVMGNNSFYNYLKKRIQEEFYGDIKFAVCYKENDVEKIILIYDYVVQTMHFHLDGF